MKNLVPLKYEINEEGLGIWDSNFDHVHEQNSQSKVLFFTIFTTTRGSLLRFLDFYLYQIIQGRFWSR